MPSFPLDILVNSVLSLVCYDDNATRQGPSKQRRATNKRNVPTKQQQQKCALGGFSVLPLIHWHYYDDLSIVSHGQQKNKKSAEVCCLPHTIFEYVNPNWPFSLFDTTQHESTTTTSTSAYLLCFWENCVYVVVGSNSKRRDSTVWRWEENNQHNKKRTVSAHWEWDYVYGRSITHNRNHIPQHLSYDTQTFPSRCTFFETVDNGES